MMDVAYAYMGGGIKPLLVIRCTMVKEIQGIIKSCCSFFAVESYGVEAAGIYSHRLLSP